MYLVFPLIVLYTSPNVAILWIVTMLILRLLLNPRMVALSMMTARILGVLMLLAFVTMLGPALLSSHGIMANLEALKFTAFTASFWLGLKTSGGPRQVRMSALLMVWPIFLFYVADYVTGAEFDLTQQEFLIYPPDFNSSCIIFTFLGFYLIHGSGFLSKILYGVVMGLFSIIVGSRTLSTMIVIFYAAYFRRLTLWTVMLWPVALAAGASIVINSLQVNTFSDQLRLLIWDFSFSYASQPLFTWFRPGEAAFGDVLSVFPFYRNLQVQHAHNMLLHIWASYGLLPVLLTVILIMMLFHAAWRKGDRILVFQLFALLAFAQLESVITDSRIFCAILFHIGLRLRSAADSRRGRPVIQGFPL